MAMAVQRLHKGAQVTIGPWIERGFYYDFDMPEVCWRIAVGWGGLDE